MVHRLPSASFVDPAPERRLPWPSGRSFLGTLGRLVSLSSGYHNLHGLAIRRFWDSGSFRLLVGVRMAIESALCTLARAAELLASFSVCRDQLCDRTIH